MILTRENFGKTISSIFDFAFWGGLIFKIFSEFIKIPTKYGLNDP